MEINGFKLVAHTSSDGSTFEASDTLAPVSVFFFDNGTISLITVRIGEGVVQAHGHGETRADSLTDAENVLRDICPRAWEFYASTVTVSAREGVAA